MGLRKCPCDCSGRAVATFVEGFILYATICPNCDCEADENKVTLTDLQGNVIFQSNIVKPSSCASNGDTTSLSASGEGIINETSSPATFQVTLIDQTTDFDLVVFTLTDLSDVFSLFFLASDGEVTITNADCPGE